MSYFRYLDSGVLFTRRRHRGRWNVLFTDSHVAAFKTKQLFAVSPEVRRRWNIDFEPHPEFPPFNPP